MGKDRSGQGERQREGVEGLELLDVEGRRSIVGASRWGQQRTEIARDRRGRRWIGALRRKY